MRAEPVPCPTSRELSDPFVVRLMQLLRDQGRRQAALEHLEDELSRAGLRPQRGAPPRAAPPGREPGHGRQLRAQPPPALGRRLERVLRAASHVEAILREDPAGIYPRQEFATSDRYRRVVEMIARGVERRRDRSGARASTGRQGSARRDRRRLEPDIARPCRLLSDRPRPGRR